MYTFNELQYLDLEASSLCNALCAICNRRYSGGQKVENMVETYITFNQFKDWFNPDFLKNLRGISLCGNYGDPMTNPELLDILRYTKDINPKIEITMNTNASGRTPEFWAELSEIINTNGHLTFSVDGLKNTNWIYRRGTKWDKIITAMESYASGPGYSKWEFLVFKHNQHQVEEARQLAEKIGITKFYAKEAFGFEDTMINNNKKSSFSVYNEQNNFLYSIHAPDGKSNNTEIIQDIVYGNQNPDTKNKHVKFKYNASTPLNEWEVKLGNTCIDCQVLNKRSIFITSEGLVFPCCMTAGKLYAPGTPEAVQLREFVNSRGRDKISLNNNTLESIVNSKIFQTDWPDNWRDNDVRNKRLRVCSMFCGTETNQTWEKISESVDNLYMPHTNTDG